MSNKPFKLRDHQEEAVEQIEACLAFGSDNLIVRAVTSFGKSAVIAKVADMYQDRGVMIVVNITALIDQISEHLDHFNVDHSILKAGRNSEFDPTKKVQIVMAQTLNARIDKIEFTHKFDIWQQDEAHKEWDTKRTNTILESIKPEIKIGYTATPWTADGFALPGSEIVETITDDELTKKGYLAPINYYIPRWSEKIDYSKIKKTAGEYNMSALDLIIGSESYIKGMIESMNQLKIKSEQKKFLVFTTTTEMADRITDALKGAGYEVEAYHSKVHKKTLDNIMESFKENTPYKGAHQEDKSLFDEESGPQAQIRGLVSVAKIAVGFSVSDIDVGVIARAIGSRNLWPQIVGRLKRTHDSKTHADILDLGKNCSRNGFPEDPYTPPEKTGLKDQDKISLNNALEHLAMDHMTAAIQSDEPEIMTRDKYNLVLEELKRNKTRLTEMTPRQLSDKLEVTDDPVEMIAIACVLFDKIHCTEMQDKWGRPTRGYIQKNTKEVKGFLNPDSISWIAEGWVETLADEKEYYRKKYIKALRTRIKNSLIDKSSVWGLKYFIEFLIKEDELEKQIVEQSLEAQEPMRIEFEGFEDEVPF